MFSCVCVCVCVCVCFRVCVCVCVREARTHAHVLAQLCLTLQPHGLYSLPGSSVHGILQARILEWVAISSSRGNFPTQGLNSCLFHLLHCQFNTSTLRHPGSRFSSLVWYYNKLCCKSSCCSSSARNNLACFLCIIHFIHWQTSCRYFSSIIQKHN